MYSRNDRMYLAEADRPSKILRKRSRDSLEIFFLIGSSIYLITLAVPFFLNPSFESDDQNGSKVLLTRRSRKRPRQNHLNSHSSNYLRPSNVLDMSIQRVVNLSDLSNHSTSRRPQHQQNTFVLEHDQFVSNHQSINYVVDPDDQAQRADSKDCVPLAKWQSMSFPTCNLFHETNIFSTSRVLSHFSRIGHMTNRFHQSSDQSHNAASVTINVEHNVEESYKAKLLGNGWFRDAWKVTNIDQNSSIAVKTLRLQRDFLPEYYELHRRDAVSMERLTSSPYVMNIYGNCGNSAMTELAFGEQGIDTLYRLATGLKDNFTPYVLRTKLQIATMIAMGLSHVHSVPSDDKVSSSSTFVDMRATIAHNDFNPRNIIISSGGTPKINDFNCAEFLSWNVTSEKDCGFVSRFHEPWWRAPEEMIVYNKTNTDGANGTIHYINEKADVYALGNNLFVLLTGVEPRGKEHKKLRYDNVSLALAKGETPQFPRPIAESTDPAISAIRDAITRCWERDQDTRPQSAEIAQFLYNALEGIKQHVR